MRYEIKGEQMPVVICHLDAGEYMITEKGAMVWMSDNMKMETTSAGKGFSRMLSGESFFQNIYTAKDGPGMIAFGSSFPGNIMAFQLQEGQELVAQKSAFLASTPGIELSIFFQKKVAAGFFGGEGFIMQRIRGKGIVFLEIDGSTVEYNLKAGQRLVVDTGNLAMMDASCKIEVESVKGVKNKLFGGEGFFNTVVTGPGKVILQTMPLSSFARSISRLLPSG